jgi:RNA polymerase sigma-70 factor (ECF subfamily)
VLLRNARGLVGVNSTVVGRPLAEAALVERAKRGDDDAYEALVRLHQDIAFRTAYLITGSAADADETTQDAFLKAHRALGRFRTDAPFRPWLLTIVANEARNRRRASGRRENVVARAAAEIPSGGAAPSPEAELLASEERARVLGAVGQLAEDDRLVIALRFFAGLTQEETAAALGLPAGTVKSRLSRALGRLRERMEVEA